MLLIVDACCGDLWANDVPPNVAMVSTKHKSGLGTENEDPEEADCWSNLTNWFFDAMAFDRALHKLSFTNNASCMEHLEYFWKQINWNDQKRNENAKLIFLI